MWPSTRESCLLDSMTNPAKSNWKLLANKIIKNGTKYSSIVQSHCDLKKSRSQVWHPRNQKNNNPTYRKNLWVQYCMTSKAWCDQLHSLSSHYEVCWSIWNGICRWLPRQFFHFFLKFGMLWSQVILKVWDVMVSDDLLLFYRWELRSSIRLCLLEYKGIKRVLRATIDTQSDNGNLWKFLILDEIREIQLYKEYHKAHLF